MTTFHNDSYVSAINNENIDEIKSLIKKNNLDIYKLIKKKKIDVHKDIIFEIYKKRITYF